MNKIRTNLASNTTLKGIYYAIRRGLKHIVFRLSPALLAKFRYRSAWRRWPDFTHPKTLDEKLLWLMLYDRDPRKAVCTDKYAKYDYLNKLGLGHILPNYFAVYDRVDDINLSTLPDRFVLKCTHGCKCNVFCKRKSEFDLAEARRMLAEWLATDFSLISGEIHYGAIPPRILCEEFLEEPGAVLPTDYKLHCCNGRVAGTLVCTERDPNGLPKLQFYDREWTHQLPYIIPAMQARQDMPKPAAYDKMLALAENLAQPFPFVRVDFYYIQGKVLLGELTFTPGGCVSADYLNETCQNELGALIKLPE